jgi:transposase
MKYGLKITQEAYEVKRSTLYNWQKKYKDKGIEGLINGDRGPRRKRQSQIRREIKEYLNWYNTQRHHKGLNYQTPFGYSLEVLNAKESDML